MTVSRLLAVAVALAAIAAVPAASATGVEKITTVAGTGAPATGPGVDGEPATQSAIDHPRGVDVSATGEVLVAEPFRNTVRRIDGAGRVARVAGTGVRGYSGDGGPAVTASLDGVHGVAFMPGGGFVLADTGNHRIRRVWADGTITTVAGTGEPGYSGDGGPAVAARIEAPRGVSALADGGFLIPDTGNDRIRRVWPDGTITTVAGSGIRGFGGDGGPALAAQLALPFAAVPLPDGGLLIADTANERIRRVLPDGIIVTVAGTGVAGSAGDGGPATRAMLDTPHAAAALPDGSVLVADTAGHRIRRIRPDGIITTAAGTGTAGYSGDGGVATAALLDQPKALAARADGSFVIGDSANNRIRAVTVEPLPPLTVRVTPSTMRTVTGRAATLRYVLSEQARVQMTVRRGGTTVLGIRQGGAKGLNRASFGRRLKPGVYRLRLVATTSDGRTAHAVAVLRVERSLPS